MHQAGIKNLISMSPTPALYNDGSATGRSAVDIWVLLPVMYNNAKGEVTHVLKKGDEVWSYNTAGAGCLLSEMGNRFRSRRFPYPARLHQPEPQPDRPALLAGRSLGSDPWNNVNNTGAFSSANYPGEGMLVYPGQQVGVPGVVASMRLKWLRDGVEDYDYAEILKGLGKADLAMQIARSVGPDWTPWTRDPKAVDAARQMLGEAIDHLMSRGTEENTSAEGLPAEKLAIRSQASDRWVAPTRRRRWAAGKCS